MVVSIEAKVAHVWRRLGFGPTHRDIRIGAALGVDAVIESFLAKPLVAFDRTGFPPVTAPVVEHQGRQLEMMAFGPVSTGVTTPAADYNPLQERVAWLLQGLLVVGMTDVVFQVDLLEHIAALRGALDSDYHTLLSQVVTTAGMVKYLTGDLNDKAHPNQNLARELLELFSLGATDPATGASNYDQQDVVEVARALTGWRYSFPTRTLAFDPDHWDGGDKTFLGAPRGAAGVTEVLDAILEQPSWAHYVPARFYRELTGFDASPEVLDSLTSAWGAEGDVAALVAEIARRPEFTAGRAVFNRTKTALERVVAAARLLAWPELATDMSIHPTMAQMGQIPWVPPNVSGWPKGDQWLNSSNLLVWSRLANLMATRGFDENGQQVGTISPFVTKVFTKSTPSTAARFVCDQAGLIPTSYRTVSVLDAYARGGSWSPSRAAGLVNLTLLSPEFLAN